MQEVDAGVVGSALEHGHEGVERGLRGAVGHAGGAAVHNVAAVSGHLEAGGQRPGRRSVRVEVDGHARGHFADGGQQWAGLQGPQQAAHVLDAQDVRAGTHGGARHALVVGQVVDGRGEDVAGVAETDLGHLARGAHGVDGDLHALHVVEAVEDAEDVHAVDRGQTHEL